jgi:Mn2+/Fe2+ NRAMP family transporter
MSVRNIWPGAWVMAKGGCEAISAHVRDITRGSVTGVLITGVVRVLLVLAILGVVSGGAALDPKSQAASAFQHAAGQVGLHVFGIVLWAASITSVIGASYPSVTFVTSRERTGERTRSVLGSSFIVLTAGVNLLSGTAPVTLLVFAGAFNGVLLPVGIGVVLWVAWRRTDLLNGYSHPRWLLASVGGHGCLPSTSRSTRSDRSSTCSGDRDMTSSSTSTP